MSKLAVEWITGKIVLDASFREALIADPDQTLAGFDLLEIEKAYLKRIDLETMEALAQTLTACTSRISPASPDPFQNKNRNLDIGAPADRGVPDRPVEDPRKESEL